MSVLQQPHYVIKPTELADWRNQEPDTWWLVDGVPRLTGERIDFPCPGDELAELLRRYKKDLFFYPVPSTSTGPQPAGQPIGGRDLNELADRDNPEKRRTFLFTWSDRDDEWLLVEYPSWKLDEDDR
jgi:hypothetical protein